MFHNGRGLLEFSAASAMRLRSIPTLSSCGNKHLSIRKARIRLLPSGDVTFI